MFRLFYLTFHGEWRGRRDQVDHLKESPPVMTLPLVVLGVLSIGGGWVLIPKILGGGAWFEHFLEPVFTSPEGLGELAPPSHFTEYLVMGVSIVAAVGGILWARAWYIVNPDAPARLVRKGKLLYQILLNKYYIDEIYDFTVVQTVIGIGDGLWHWVDINIIDGIVNGTARMFEGLGLSLIHI